MYGDRKQIQAAAAATGNGTNFHVRKWAVTVFSVTGTFDGTITFEGTVDGANWSSIQVHNLSNGNVSTTATATGLYGCNVLGLGDVRARISTYTSGTISVEVRGVDVGSGESLADTSFAPDASLTVDQPLYWLLHTSAHLNVYASEVNASNPVPVSHIGCINVCQPSYPISTVNLIHDHFNVNANLQVSDVDVGPNNPVPISFDEPVEVSVVNNTVPIESAGITITQTPTITAGGYTAGDNVGGLLTFEYAARDAGGGGVIKDVIIVDDASESIATELWLFNQTFTAGADNAVWTPVEAELHNLITVVSTNDGTYYTGGATATIAIVEVARRYDITGTSIFGRLVTRGTPTYNATDDITVRISLLQD